MILPDFGSCEEVGGEQYALNLYTLAESIRAMTILEVGAGWGWSARAFAHSLAKRNGLLVSIDPQPERILDENITETGSLEFAWDIRKAYSKDVEFTEPIDLLYIDGDPKNVEEDFNRFYGNVRDGGLVVIDGYTGQSYPTEFVEKCTDWSTRDFIGLPYSDTYCHAVHRKPLSQRINDKYEAVCNDCGKTFRAGYWSALDDAIDEHIKTESHVIAAIAGPRNRKYIKGRR